MRYPKESKGDRAQIDGIEGRRGSTWGRSLCAVFDWVSEMKTGEMRWSAKCPTRMEA